MVSYDPKSMYHLYMGRRDGAMATAKLAKIWGAKETALAATNTARSFNREAIYYKRLMHP